MGKQFAVVLLLVLLFLIGPRVQKPAKSKELIDCSVSSCT